MTATPVGQRIRDVRLQHGIGLRQLARAVGVSAQALADWETGHRRCNHKRIEQVEKAMRQLVMDRPTPTPQRRCQRPGCGGRVVDRFGDLTCLSCGQSPERKELPPEHFARGNHGIDV